MGEPMYTIDADALAERVSGYQTAAFNDVMDAFEERDRRERERVAKLETDFAAAAARIRELEIELAIKESTIADLRDFAYNRAPKIAAEEADRQKAELLKENARLEAALRAYPEWMDDDHPQAVGTMQRFVTCLICGGGGAFNGDGKPSKRIPPTHNPDCARQSALEARLAEAEQNAAANKGL